MFLRKHMDSQGFVFLGFIAGFNRIKQLTTDMELIKFVCYQSRTIEFRVGPDGRDRLRPREGWEKWVLAMPERDSAAQNDGPGELHPPPQPHPNGYEQVPYQQYPPMPAGSPSAPVPYPTMNGAPSGVPQTSSTPPSDNLPNGQMSESVNGFAGSNGHDVESASKDVSGEPDSFSDEQVATLSVIVKPNLAQAPTLPPSASRTFSNGSIDSRSGVPDDSDKVHDRQSSVKINGTGPSQG
jgi:la-related protein 1